MPTRTSVLSILSFTFSILGIISFINLYYHLYSFAGMLILPLILLFLSVIFGISAIIRISFSGGKLKGKLFAVTGIIIGLFFILLMLLGMVL